MIEEDWMPDPRGWMAIKRDRLGHHRHAVLKVLLLGEVQADHGQPQGVVRAEIDRPVGLDLAPFGIPT